MVVGRRSGGLVVPGTGSCPTEHGVAVYGTGFEVPSPILRLDSIVGLTALVA
jgi:hypothetical protein